MIGFIVPGILLAIAGGGIALSVTGRRGLVFWLLAVSGMGFAGTGVLPAEMRGGSPLMQSPWTIGHVVMMFVSGLPWVVGALLLPRYLGQHAVWRRFKGLGVAFGLLAIGSLVFNVVSRDLPYFSEFPGLAQRIAFAVYFAWFLVIGLAVCGPAQGERIAVPRVLGEGSTDAPDHRA